MIKEGDVVLLRGKESFVIRVKKGMARVGRGTADLSKLIEKDYGDSIRLWGEEFKIYRPSREDILNSMERGAQVILPKDIAQIIFMCDIRSGDVVLEAGSGSGWLTSSLALSVMPSGRVISYDVSAKSLDIARKNIENMGLGSFVEFRHGDVRTEDIGESVDACVLDMPDPWNAFENIERHLKAGGHLCMYVPTYNQVEESVMHMENFFDVRVVELIMRGIDAKKGATRPAFKGLMHTGFIIHGRKN